MSGLIEERLAGLGLSLPAVFAGPPGIAIRFELVRVAGGVAYVAGHGPMDGSRVLVSGKVGEPVSGEVGRPTGGAYLSVDAGREAARLTALSMLASLQAELGSLDRVSGWLKVLGFVNAAPGFDRTPAVVDGFSDLILELWGESGRHARSAVGVAELPLEIPVEVEAVVAVD